MKRYQSTGPSRQGTPDQPPWRAGPPHHGGVCKQQAQHAEVGFCLQQQETPRAEFGSTRYLTQKSFRSECMAFFAGCESPRQAILLASTPARRNAAGCSPPLLSFTTCIRVLNQVRGRMFVLCSRVSTTAVRVNGYAVDSSGPSKCIAMKARAQVPPP